MATVETITTTACIIMAAALVYMGLNAVASPAQGAESFGLPAFGLHWVPVWGVRDAGFGAAILSLILAGKLGALSTNAWKRATAIVTLTGAGVGLSDGWLLASNRIKQGVLGHSIGGAIMAACAAGLWWSATEHRQPQARHGTIPEIQGLHHIKLPVADIETTLAFYTTVLPFVHLPKLDHLNTADDLYGVIVTHPTASIFVELRKNPEQAARQKRWDPITWAVRGRRELEEWAAWFEARGVEHSRVLKGAKGWVLCAEDPDGKFVKLYTLEEHEWTKETDVDEYWLGEY